MVWLIVTIVTGKNDHVLFSPGDLADEAKLVHKLEGHTALSLGIKNADFLR